ncbi:sulfatase [Candidatus Poribacteria bacterium]|nr:sulfatase [Candidatus Poribacteria bacterium]
MNKPNFIFILIDDLGWKDLSCYDSTFYETPNLDQMATDGMRFTNAYASCPVCSPTRASILTGRYPATLGLTNFIGGRARGKLVDAPYVDHLSLEEKTVALALKRAGYRTYHVGKWHLGGEPYWPEKHGFDVNIGGCHWGMPRSYFSPYNMPNLENGPDGEYLTDRLTDEAIKLIENNGNEPFFMYLSHYAVHIPIQTPEKYIKKYEQKAKERGLDRLKTFAEGDFFPCEHKKDQRIIRRLLQSDPAYAGMVENLDENIGRVLKAVDEAGLTENTVVIFTSDNGGLATAEGSPTCNAPLNEGKGWMYEGGTREPLIIKWPNGIEAGSLCDVPVTSPDFYPTILEMAGLELIPEQHCDGVSFLPLLKGTGTLNREAIFWHYPHYGNQGGTPGSSVRCRDYKLIEFFEDGRLELYNLRGDVSEEHNIAKDKPDITQKLKEMLVDWREKVEAKIPEPNPDYKPW